MRSKNIIVTAVRYFPDQPSGSSRLAYDEALYLAGLGHEVWMMAPAFSRSKPEHSFETGLHVLRYPSPQLRAFDPRRVQVHQRLTNDLLTRYVGPAVDLVIGHSLFQYDEALSLYGGRARSRFSVHSPIRLEMLAASRGAPAAERLRLLISSQLTNRVERRCLRRSHRITAFSDFTRTMLGQFHGKGIQERVQVIPGWVDLTRFVVAPNREMLKAELGWPTDVPVFFCLRRLVPRMGLDRLLHAARKVKSAGWCFRLILGGDGRLRNQLEALTRDLGLSAEVQFAGFVPEDTLPKMYAAADAFVLPTADLECFGLIALEALACGRPVLATPVAAIPEIMEQVEPQWLARDVQADSIAALLIKHLKHELPGHDAGCLRQFVAQRYAKERVLAELAIAAGAME